MTRDRLIELRRECFVVDGAYEAAKETADKAREARDRAWDAYNRALHGFTQALAWEASK
jgi:hypothetical protein